MTGQQTTAPEIQRQLQSLNILSPSGNGEVFFHGALITAWTPNCGDPVLWLGSRNQFLDHEPIRVVFRSASRGSVVQPRPAMALPGLFHGSSPRSSTSQSTTR
ncbi:hypothetical protein ACFVYC_09740 [Pseudarthrobacter sp. NPDC058329]|uniref:hypothetical protein n=1 Tax=Pseudarthrobacter sp. NPDC058329 TaxID=3346448 RepID=UPI0036DE6DDE